MSQFPDTSRSADDCRDLKPVAQGRIEPQPGPRPTDLSPDPSNPAQEEEVRQPDNSPTEETTQDAVRLEKHEPEHQENANEDEETQGARESPEQREEPTETMTSEVLIAGDVMTPSESHAPRPRLVTSNSGADIMLGLETDEGKTAEVEIDSLESDELQPEEIPKGRVRKTSIVEKLSKSKESELIALTIMESAGQRQREFEQLINEHQELVHEISRTPSAENIVQSEDGRDP
ncbi:hypothetical protein ElyMa_003926800 [Elysia marginata]|uniref:Uncharacterized protein n=1 Tax=Elysia marginata TaxID=1093978 RepID=A0AAV4FQK8_9GAST|nr:hypothetical protein ElyMa_003926800 [Elysia marginata]